jgi:2-desacetyl-2-hydroxyethyl bacteriochlorophyllide A dehydrogenase
VKAVLFEAVRELRLVEMDPPILRHSDEVLIEVAAVGICGSEIHAFKGTHPFRRPPSVLGHEVTGRIVKVGAAPGDFTLGDRVFVDPQWSCGTCGWCLSGCHHLCPSKKVLGTAAWSGGLGEYIVAPVQSLYHLPDHVSYVTGTLIEPLSVAVHQVNSVGLGEGESVAILGTGPIGMMVAAVVSARGARPVIAVDVQERCLDVAQESFGVTHGLLAAEGCLAERVLGITQGRGVDIVFLTVGVPVLVQEALKMVAIEGKIVFVALFDEPIQLDANDITQKHLTLRGSSMYNRHDIRTAVGLISSGEVTADAMVTHVLPLEEARRGFDLAATKDEDAIKVVLDVV